MQYSEDTHTRAKENNIETVSTDIALVEASNYIISIVPPRDALGIAHRITAAFNALSAPKELYYIDLNAISPRRAREIASHFQSTAPSIKLIDGGIVGGPPFLKSGTGPSTEISIPGAISSVQSDSETGHAWNRPDVPVSGPHDLIDAPVSGAHLSETLNLNHISQEIGPASGLKCCFASATKGFIAICIQSFTTASNLGVLPLLQELMEQRMPGQFKAAKSGVTGMPPKAYRWVREMEEIALAHADDGGFQGGKDGTGVFGEIAKVYKSVADETILGEEKTERRKRGLTVEDVASTMGDGLGKKKKKTE